MSNLFCPAEQRIQTTEILAGWTTHKGHQQTLGLFQGSSGIERFNTSAGHPAFPPLLILATGVTENPAFSNGKDE